MQSVRRDVLSKRVPSWLSVLALVAVIAPAIIFVLVVKPGPDPNARAEATAAMPPVTVGAEYPVMISPGSTAIGVGPGSKETYLPAWPSGGDVSASPGETITAGYVLICTIGLPETVQIVDIKPLRAQRPVNIVGFATRQVSFEYMLKNGSPWFVHPGTLASDGFQPSSHEVTACNRDLNEPYVGSVYASTQLDVEYQLQAPTTEEDDGLIISYQAPTGPVRTFTVPIIYGLRSLS